MPARHALERAQVERARCALQQSLRAGPASCAIVGGPPVAIPLPRSRLQAPQPGAGAAVRSHRARVIGPPTLPARLARSPDDVFMTRVDLDAPIEETMRDLFTVSADGVRMRNTLLDAARCAPYSRRRRHSAAHPKLRDEVASANRGVARRARVEARDGGPGGQATRP